MNLSNGNVFDITITIATIVFAIVVFFKFKRVMQNVIDDTLKRYDDSRKRLKWSSARLTMLSAWVIATWSYIYEQIFHGFNVVAFATFVGVGVVGPKLVDALCHAIINGYFKKGFGNKNNDAPEAEEKKEGENKEENNDLPVTKD